MDPNEKYKIDHLYLLQHPNIEAVSSFDVVKKHVYRNGSFAIDWLHDYRPDGWGEQIQFIYFTPNTSLKYIRLEDRVDKNKGYGRIEIFVPLDDAEKACRACAKEIARRREIKISRKDLY